MGFRFRKSIKIAPGVKLNLGKKSTGISVGNKFGGVSINTKTGVTTRVSAPGTGMSYTSRIGGKHKRKSARSSVAEHHRAGLWVLTLLYTGMRPGETAALTWSDVDFEHNEIHVHTAKESGSRDVKGPKTSSGYGTSPSIVTSAGGLRRQKANRSPWFFRTKMGLSKLRAPCAGHGKASARSWGR